MGRANEQLELLQARTCPSVQAAGKHTLTCSCLGLRVGLFGKQAVTVDDGAGDVDELAVGGA